MDPPAVQKFSRLGAKNYWKSPPPQHHVQGRRLRHAIWGFGFEERPILSAYGAGKRPGTLRRA